MFKAINTNKNNKKEMSTHEKEFDAQQAEFEKLGEGAHEHVGDVTHQLPPGFTQSYFDGEKLSIKNARRQYTDAQTIANEKYDDYIKLFNDAELVKNNSVRLIKGLYGPYSETLRDYGVLPNKKSSGRPPLPTTP